jgi:D,D-heptose 1,7-bisphosphate phosphatase
MLKKAVILAGGKGTRLKSISKTIPKPMMPVAGKPLLEYQIELCKKYGLEEVILIVNHLKDSIIDYFGNGEKWGIKVSYFEEPSPLGTVGGVKEIEDELTEDFLVLYGDVIMEMDLQRLYDFHRNNKSDVSLVVHPNDHPYDSDLVEVDAEDRVTHFHSKPLNPEKIYHNLVNAAAYVFSPKILKYLEKGKKADFGKDIFPNLLNKLNVFAYNTTEYLKDMGTPDRLEKVTRDVTSGKLANRSLSKKQKAIFLDRDGVLNYDTDLIHRTEDFTLYDYTAETVKRINQSEYLAIVITNQSIIARGLTNLKGLDDIHKKMEWELGEQRAYLDAIYFCPHHPHGGFEGEVPEFKKECSCRKPKPGMILEAAERFNIDLSQSFMIGDSERDAGAGRAAGVTTIGVMTGHGVKKAEVLPEYFVANLPEAIDLILGDQLKVDVKRVEQILPKKEKLIVSIGGNSRSGKSTLASALSQSLVKGGKSVFRINLDDWILPKGQREKEIDVYSNFQLPKLEQDVKSILSGTEVTIDAYIPHHDRKAAKKTYAYNNEDVILIEGVVALSSEELLNLSDIKVFKDISTFMLKARLQRFYNWKEYSKAEFETLYAKREKDEYEKIDNERFFADLVV